MKPTHRSLAGAAIALLALPAFLGLMACLPVPVGNPEKSRIDPELTGVWFMPGDGAIVILDPFDKRSWLMTVVGVERDDDWCPVDDDQVSNDPSEFEQFIEILEIEGPECLTPDGEVGLYKTWVTELGGETFMIWEPRLFWAEDFGFNPAIWFVFRVDRVSPDRLSLVWVDVDYFEEVEGLEELVTNLDEDIVSDPGDIRRVSRRVTRMIRRNVDDPKLYYDDDENILIRMPADHLAGSLEIVDEIIGLE